MSKVSVADLSSHVYLGRKFWVVKSYFFENFYVALVELAVLDSINKQLVHSLLQLCARL